MNRSVNAYASQETSTLTVHFIHRVVLEHIESVALGQLDGRISLQLLRSMDCRRFQIFRRMVWLGAIAVGLGLRLIEAFPFNFLFAIWRICGMTSGRAR